MGRLMDDLLTEYERWLAETAELSDEDLADVAGDMAYERERDRRAEREWSA